jgi:hypothetical protein
VDVGIEYDAGLGTPNGPDLLGRPEAAVKVEQIQEASGVAAVDDDQSAQNALRFSNVVGGGIGGKPTKFPLDWASISNLFGSLPPAEKEGLGIEVCMYVNVLHNQ